MDEFKVTIASPAVVNGNFEDIKQGLQIMMTAYDGLEVTEANIPERKKDVATLRKMADAIEKKRKEIKKEYEVPYKEFESKCKELTGIIGEQAGRLDGEIKEFDEKRKREKAARIRELYAENIGDYAEFLPLNKIESPAWLNKTTTEKSIVADIQAARLKVEQEIGMIKSVSGDFADECMKAYKANGNSLQAAIRRKDDLEYARRKAEEAAAEKERQKEMDARVDERVQNIVSTSDRLHQLADEAAQKITDAVAPFVDSMTPAASLPENSLLENYRFTVFDKQDADSVKAYMEMFGITYVEG